MWRLYVVCLSSCLQTFSNSTPSELKCKTGIKKLRTIGIISYTESWCLVPFSSNISWVRTQRGSVLVRLKKQRGIHYRISLRRCVVHRGTQQKYSVTKRAFTRRSWATLVGVNEASFQVMFICKYKLLIKALLAKEGTIPGI